jgi:hypothetical protein
MLHPNPFDAINGKVLAIKSEINGISHKESGCFQINTVGTRSDDFVVRR